MVLRFSEVFNIDRVPEDDWFDTYLPSDSLFCIDPFLIYDEESGMWSDAHSYILDFFAMVINQVRLSQGNRRSIHWRKAQQLLVFPEPSEFCLGVSEGSPLGAGSGVGLQRGMLDGIDIAVGLGMQRVPHLELLSLFQGGMGLDRISDVVCNILKSYFIRYTQDVCARHSIPTRQFDVRHASWTVEHLRWKSEHVDLPVNPFLDRPHPVLLTPERFLRDIPVVTANGFWRYAWSNHAEELRGDFNFDIATRVPPRVKAELARKNPTIVLEYLGELEEVQHEPYPLDRDPKLLVKWHEKGASISLSTPLRFVPERQEDFPRFIETIVEAFRHNIEQQDGWELLWFESRPRKERAVQALFRSAVIHYCRANNIDLSGESNAGRGPVDFKFSQGWSSRALVEIKLVRNSHYWDGILAQTPQYMLSEEVSSAYFVAVAFYADELSSGKTKNLQKAALTVSRDGLEVRAVIVDATRKSSASKLRASGRNEPEDSPASESEGEDEES